MLSLLFGLVAALAWGLHDFGIRLVSAKSAALPSFLVVLLTGSVLLAPVTGFADWGQMTLRAYGLSGLAGLCYVLGGVGLYQAFAIGPVRLVAPVAGSFPIVSVGLAAAFGSPVSLGQWLAICTVLGGITVVASASQDHSGPDPAGAPRRVGAALGWAAAGALGFGLTFWFGQAATLEGVALPVQLVTRLSATAGLLMVIAALRQPVRIHRPHLPLLTGMGALDVTALGFVLAGGALPHPEFAAVSSSIFGVVTVVLAWRFLREPMTGAQWIGVSAVFAGIAYLAL